MNNEMQREVKNSKNNFELDGNVANINDIYVSKNGKKLLRFDLAQNNNGNTEFVPIVLKGELVNSYGKEIQKGDWITVKGRISTYTKERDVNGISFNEKAIDILGFEIIDKKNEKVYTSNGEIHELSKKKENEMER